MNHIPELTFTIQIFQEGRTYVAYTPELDVSSCGRTLDDARTNLGDAVRGFLKSASRMGTLDAILEEAGFVRARGRWSTPPMVTLDRFSVAV
jgi:predicted RNase H-like HicB family nuclease